jgi:hypothetical protein
MCGGFTCSLPCKEIIHSCGPVMSRVLSCTAVSKSSLCCFASHWCSCSFKQIVNKALQQHRCCTATYCMEWTYKVFSVVLLNIHHINPYILPLQLHWLAVFVWNMPESMWECSFGGLGVSVLASGTQVRGFTPGRSRQIFKGGKILSTPSFGREVKPWVPCRRFAACKRSLNVLWKLAFRLNYRSPFSAHKFQPRHWSGGRVGRRGGI